ncbi:LysR substrate-binding domain-containing protein [Rhodoplanes sp. TEM]|uniref:LysR substrate-binding domain-containing protein n=2 Tax=Rhodoplanes TaxID=29407 RepID=A0ABT5J4S1_RHOTP|nr:LysR substrate-binding domain-containing protein [Rhodoplanes tepidamans]MDC7784447.1 LysR substrate-binding domain-containing protein [Rhodoplanes tepidamans]MDC7983477.1 LysR substrate-binding domain-containing protein [Rhodoplanes sp. TEM]MDQ0356954.1 DNA-binding transcriptional LysR family regulator [Rhodoplanes tepidamans]
MLSLRELDVFRRIMAHGTITAAAEALHISQPAVSRMLQQAEQRLGFPLFLRHRKRLIATSEAQALFPDTVAAFAALDTVQRRAADLKAGTAGVLEIAAISAFANALLPAAIARFRAPRPDVVVTLRATSALDVATRVANHQADIGFIIDSTTVPGVSVGDLCATAFGAVLPAGHRLAGAPWVAPADLAEEPLICLGRHLPLGLLAMRAFAEADVPFRVAIEVTQSTVACAMVRAGAGVALLDGLGLMGAPGGDLVLRPFRPAVQVAGRLVRPRHRPPSRLAEDFVAVVRAVVAASDPGLGVPRRPAGGTRNGGSRPPPQAPVDPLA